MSILRRITGAAMCALILAGAGALAPAGARAQAAPGIDTGDPNVVVDFSVLDDAGHGPAPVYTPAAPVYLPAAPIGRRLLIPGPKNPVSQLHIPPVRGSKKAKSSRTAKAAPARAPAKRKLKAAAPPAKAKPKKVAAAPPPAKAPEKPPVTVSAIPAPLTAPPPPPPAAPAPTKKAEPAPAPKPEAVPSPALTPPPPPVIAETAAKAEKTPAVAAASPKAEPTAEEKAALPPAGAPLAPGRAMQIVFKPSASKLPGTAKADLKTLAARLKEKPNLRLQLMAYAGGESLSAGKARRLSLSRALSVRSYLIANGVRSTRIDVRALGNKLAEEPFNRVDVNVAER